MIEFNTEKGPIRVTQGEQYGDICIQIGEKAVMVDSAEFADICEIFLSADKVDHAD